MYIACSNVVARTSRGLIWTVTCWFPFVVLTTMGEGRKCSSRQRRS